MSFKYKIHVLIVLQSNIYNSEQPKLVGSLLFSLIVGLYNQHIIYTIHEIEREARGPFSHVNAHITPGLGIYRNDCLIHVYTHGTGADNPLGTKL